MTDSTLSTSEYFERLDSDFYGNDSTRAKDVTPICWQTKDYYVERQFELPIPTNTGSLITYEFSTTGGDINFSLIFSPLYYTDDTNDTKGNDYTDEVVISPSRLPSDSTVCSGNYEAKCDGTLLFIFDNTYSWFNTKLLTYNIYLYEPAFDSADNSRSLKSKKLLDRIVKENEISEKRLSQTQERLITLQEEIDTLTNTLREYEITLNEKNQSLQYVVHEINDMNKRIAINEEKINGLCIRSLGKYETIIILKYLNGNANTSSVKTVCKYWNLLCKEDNETIINDNTQQDKVA